MIRDIRTSWLEEFFFIFLPLATTVKVFFDFSGNNTKYLKSSVQNVTGIFVTEKKYIYNENPISIG